MKLETPSPRRSTPISERATILVCSSSAIFGGHEVMTARLVNALSKRLERSHRVMLLAHSDELRRAVNPDVARDFLAQVDGVPLPFARNLRPDHVIGLAARIRRSRADLVIASQGNIELGLKAVLAARLAGVKVASYLPMAYTFAESGSRLSWVRDAIDRIYYRAPQLFITIAEHQRSLLHRFTDAPVLVVRNPIGFEATSTPVTPLHPTRAVQIAVVGRVYFQHKGQDILPDLSRCLSAKGIAAHFHVIGDGPDLARLRYQIQTASEGEHFTFYGQLPAVDTRRVMSDNCDLLLIPSRHEGVPLVFLEAAALGRRIVMAPLAFAADYPLPTGTVTRRRDAASLAEAIQVRLSRDDVGEVERLRQFVLQHHSQESFERDIDQLLPSLGRDVIAS